MRPRGFYELNRSLVLLAYLSGSPNRNFLAVLVSSHGLDCTGGISFNVVILPQTVRVDVLDIYSLFSLSYRIRDEKTIKSIHYDFLPTAVYEPYAWGWKTGSP